MSAVFALDGDYAGGHVPALMALGVLRIGDLLRAALPEPADPATATPEQLDAFVALLLGALSLDTRLRSLADPPSDPPPDPGAELGELLR